MKTLEQKQEEMKVRLSTRGGRRRTAVAAKSVKEGKSRLTIKQALAQARRLKRDKRRWKKNYVALKSDKRKWFAALREHARTLHIQALQLHKEMSAAEAILRHARVRHSELTVDAQRAQDIAKGYRLGLEAAQKGIVNSDARSV
jgi:transposase InsO family protein